jgi:hypothetical protein
MKKGILCFSLSVAACLMLTSCSIDFDNPFDVGKYAENSEEVYKNGTSYFQNIMSNKGMETMPSVGSPQIVVVPVVFGSDSEISNSTQQGQDIISDINTCFFGSSEDTNYLESVIPSTKNHLMENWI